MRTTGDNLLPAGIGFLVASAAWLILALVAVVAWRKPAIVPVTPAVAEARLRQEAQAILDGGVEAWRKASPDAQQVACFTNVAITHPNESMDRQRMLGRMIWAQVDYVFSDDPLGASFAQTFALIDAMDYQPKLPSKN